MATNGRTSCAFATASLKLGPSATAEEREWLINELGDFRKMNQIRARVDAIVKDKKTAEALKPWYRLFCKRPPFQR